MFRWRRPRPRRRALKGGVGVIRPSYLSAVLVTTPTHGMCERLLQTWHRPSGMIAEYGRHCCVSRGCSSTSDDEHEGVDRDRLPSWPSQEHLQSPEGEEGRDDEEDGGWRQQPDDIEPEEGMGEEMLR